MNSTQRFIWMDYAKTIGIFLVVLAHTHLYKPVDNCIYTFLMPLFFFMSGYLFSFSKNPSFRQFAAKRFKSLIIPYLWINLITYLFWLFIGRKFGDDSLRDIAWYSPAINTLLGNGMQMIHNIPTWFYICLFGLEILYYLFFKKLKNKYIGLILLTIAGYLNYTFNPYTLPFSINTAIVGMIFYTWGNIAKEKNISFNNHFTLTLLSLILVIVVTYYNGRINMYKNFYNNYFLFLVGGFSGIYLITSLSNYLSRLFKERKDILYISKNTLIISGFHLMTFSFIKGFMVFILDIPIETLYDKVSINVIFALVSILLCLPIIYIINHYFPFIMGRKRSKDKE